MKVFNEDIYLMKVFNEGISEFYDTQFLSILYNSAQYFITI